MVIGISETLTQTAVTWPVTLPELGALVGVPIKIKPWWGSRRGTSFPTHNECGHILYSKHYSCGTWRLYCSECDRFVGPDESTLKRGNRKWLCPAGNNYNELKDPEIQNGSVIIWEGKCGVKAKKKNGRGHNHQMNVEVMSVAQGAILLKLSLNTMLRRFLIGVDDGHPYVTQVNKNSKTVEEAFDWLTPNIVKKSRAAGLEVRRQGDWHFIPFDREPVLCKDGDKLYYRSLDGTMTSNSINKRTLYRGVPLIYGEETRHRGGMVVYQHIFGLPYEAPIVKGKVKAPNHPSLYLPTWHIAVRNRATNGGRGSGRFD